MNRYEQVEIDGEKLLSVEVLEKVRKGEDLLGIDHTDLASMDGEQIVAYLTELRHKYQQYAEGENKELPQTDTKSIVMAPTVRETDEQENELDEDIDEPSEIQKITVAPTIEDHQFARSLACCYLWLTSKNISERKGIMFDTPRSFQEMVTKNLCSEVPDQAEWTTWNRIYGHVLENFLTSKENIKNYKQALEEVMCNKSHWWREKYLANSELPII